jgi:sialidase-1
MHPDPTPLIRHGMLCASTPANPRADTACVVPLRDGTLLAAFHRYVASDKGGHDDGRASVVLALSSDALTWSEPEVVVAPRAEDVSVLIPSLLRLGDGALLLASTRMLPRADTGTRYGATTLELRRSGDEGHSWTYAGTIWSDAPGSRFQGGAASMLLLASGRLLYPWHENLSPGRWSDPIQAGVAISDDDGATWRIPPHRLRLAGRGAMECSVAELPHGELVMSLRTTLGQVYISRSNDGGEVWTDPAPSGLRSPQSCTCLRTLPGTSTLVLFWNDALYQPDHHHHGDRTPLSAALSNDHGRTWHRLGDIRAEPGAEFTNLGCVFMPNGDAVLSYLSLDTAFRRDQISCAVSRISRGWFDLH